MPQLKAVLRLGDLRDVVAILGVSCVGFGVGFIHWPSALIVVGAILLMSLTLGEIKRIVTNRPTL